LSNTQTTVSQLAEASFALSEAANEVADAEIRAEIAEAAVDEANREAEQARQFAADAFKAAMETELGREIQSLRENIETWQSTILSRVVLLEASQNSDVPERLGRIEALLAELETMEEMETTQNLPPSTPPTSETMTVAPPSQTNPSESGAVASPVKRDRKNRWL